MPEIQYRRLTRPGSRSGFAIPVWSSGSLWLGPDHLLSVESGGYTETCKRFYFRDIQAIIIQESKQRMSWNAILSVPLAASLIGLAHTPRDNGVVIVCLVFAAFLLLFLLINNISGTGCICRVRTAVQIEVLPSLNRVRKARRVFAEIHPLIVAAQGGELTGEAVTARMREWLASTAEPAPKASVAEDPNQPPVMGS